MSHPCGDIVRGMTSQNSFSYALTPAQQDLLKTILDDGNYMPMTVPHAVIAGKTDSYSVTLYQSGKCLVQGKGAQEFVTFVLEPLVLQSVGMGYEDILDPKGTSPHMGIDESGKGDFFGPLVTAGAYIDENIAKALRDMGVRDSKRISSDDRILGLGREIRRLLGDRFSIIKIGPAAYNRLYSKMRNVNTMLAWAHARAIENLLDAVPDCPRVLSDQFGSKELVKKALMKKGREIELDQRPKAESDIAVAAASILARESFVLSIRDMSNKHDVAIVKGASAKVRETAEAMVRDKGPSILVETAKCHFKTTDEVLRAAGFSRRDLGPEGQAVSRTTKWSRSKRGPGSPE